MPYRIVLDEGRRNSRKFAAMTNDDIRCWTQTGDYMKFANREMAEDEMYMREFLGHIVPNSARVEMV